MTPNLFATGFAAGRPGFAFAVDRTGIQGASLRACAPMEYLSARFRASLGVSKKTVKLEFSENCGALDIE
jgi:hypothetical protein